MALLDWLKELLGLKIPEPRPRPPGWNKTLTDLNAEQRSLSGEEIGWAREYELEQLRSWARFPKDGELIVALQDLPVTYITYWNGPYSHGGKGVLPAGTRLRVSVHASNPEPIGVDVTAIEAKRIEELIVPESDRRSRKYRGYGLSLNVALLNRDCRLLMPDESAD